MAEWLLNMEHTNIYSWLCNYLDEEFDIPELHEDDEFMNDLGLSSLDVFTLLADLEYEYDIKISEKLIRQMITVKDMVEAIGELLKAEKG